MYYMHDNAAASRAAATDFRSQSSWYRSKMPHRQLPPHQEASRDHKATPTRRQPQLAHSFGLCVTPSQQPTVGGVKIPQSSKPLPLLASFLVIRPLRPPVIQIPRFHLRGGSCALRDPPVRAWWLGTFDQGSRPASSMAGGEPSVGGLRFDFDKRSEIQAPTISPDLARPAKPASCSIAWITSLGKLERLRIFQPPEIARTVAVSQPSSLARLPSHATLEIALDRGGR